MTARERTAKGAIETWKRSTATELYHVYGTYSQAKQNAFEYCRRQCYERNGYDLRIVSSNTWMFTVGFLFEDTDTGATKFMYITPNYDTVVDFE